MTKQQGKQTRKDKIATGNNKPETKQKKFTERVKGPKPDFTPNMEHRAEVERQQFAKQIADAKIFASDFVAGKPGTYLIGETVGNHTEGHYFEITTKEIPRSERHEAYTLTLIVGDVSLNGSPVSMPHSWIFANEEKLERTNKFARGNFGEIQREMMRYIKRIHPVEIEQELEHRHVAEEATKKERELEILASEKPIFTLAASNGEQVHKENGKPRLISLREFAPGNFGRYDFGNQILVNYKEMGDMTVIEVHSITERHILAASGVRPGIWMPASFLNEGAIVPLTESNKTVYGQILALRAFLVEKLGSLKEKQIKTA